ncbi:HAMP domain-containing protein [candidate division WOR-3 bacterium]|nr:HAMP domain-containing protein [candidate division WOR-3 bacterium]
MSIRFKFIILNFVIIIITVIPLSFFTLRTTEFKLGMKDIPGIEKAIENAVLHTPDEEGKEEAIEALRKYRQMMALIRPLKREFITFTILLSLFIILFSTVLTVLITVRVTTPLRKLEEAAKRLAKGDFPRISGVRTKDEVGNLIKTFNRMSAALEESKKRLRIAEREAAWKDAARAVSHEIRNPLTPIRLATERLREKMSKGEKNIDEVILNTTGMILEEIENLDGIAKSFSEFAKLPEPRKKMDDVNEIIKEVVFLYSEYEGIEIKQALGENIPQFAIDRDRIKEVLINIIKNSIEAMGGGGTIWITSEFNEKEKNLTLSVKDNGCGLTVDPSLVFIPHFTTKEKGSGLGLAISKRIIEAHNGTIQVKSKEGEGTEFTITIPKK